ncbi:Hypothetical protein EIN_090370, partial [Entamoeba invadens IP1]
TFTQSFNANKSDVYFKVQKKKEVHLQKHVFEITQAGLKFYRYKSHTLIKHLITKVYKMWRQCNLCDI